jgi:hypothetical protein
MAFGDPELRYPARRSVLADELGGVHPKVGQGIGKSQRNSAAMNHSASRELGEDDPRVGPNQTAG